MLESAFCCLDVMYMLKWCTKTSSMRRERHQVSFAIVSGSEGASLYLFSGSHHFVFYFKDVKESLARMKKVTICRDEVSNGFGYIQAARAEGR